MSVRWYYPDITICEELPKADGKGMKTRFTKKDIEKYDLKPSVTSVLGVLPKPGLDIYIQKSICKAAYEYMRDEDPTTDYVDIEKAVFEKSKKKSVEASGFGSHIHHLIHRFLSGDSAQGIFKGLDEQKASIISPVFTWLEEKGFEGESELPMITERYAGTIDFKGKTKWYKKGTTDFKTQATKGRKPVFYKEWSYQLAGYQTDPDSPCTSVLISSDEPGKIEHKTWSEAEMIYGGKMFGNALKTFYDLRGLKYES